MGVGLIVGIIIIIIVVILLLVCIKAYNGMIKGKNAVEEAFATMDVYMKKRFDLIPNLVETVKGYAAHEKETLQAVIAARSQVTSASTTEERIDAENQLSGTLKSLFAVAEAYPDLKANENFMDLQRQLQTVEEDIANSRKYYNATVRDFNNRIMVFPNSLIARFGHFEKQPMYEVSYVAERENVKVEF